jgi:hypothetical protein
LWWLGSSSSVFWHTLSLSIGHGLGLIFYLFTGRPLLTQRNRRWEFRRENPKFMSLASQLLSGYQSFWFKTSYRLRPWTLFISLDGFRFIDNP